jgi:predicted transcriptional regulator
VKIIIEVTKEKVSMFAVDESVGATRLAFGHGADLKAAARWLVRRVNRTADQVEERIRELGLLTEEEIEDVLAEGPLAASVDREPEA